MKDRYQANKHEIIKEWPHQKNSSYQTQVPSVHLPPNNLQEIDSVGSEMQMDERGSQRPPQVPKVIPQSKQANGSFKKSLTIVSSRRTPPKQSYGSSALTT